MLKSLRDFLTSTLAASESEGEQSREHALQLATTALLIEMSRADAEVSAVEESAIAALVQAEFELSEDELRMLLQRADDEADEMISLYDFTRTLNDYLSRGERVRIIEMLWHVAWADGRIDKHEDYLVRKIADLLYVSHADFIKSKLRVVGE